MSTATITPAAVAVPATSTVVRRPRAVRVILWIAQIVLAGMFVMVAAPKLLGDPAAVASFHTIGFGDWFRYLTGACEVGGAIGLLIPRLSGVAAIALVGLMACATLTNLFLLPGMASAAIVTVVLGIAFALIAWGRFPQTKALVRMIRR